jgi:hypothetical protein
MNRYIITISNLEKNQFFFSTDHCQPHGLNEQWVSCTYGPLPGHVAPRESLPSGLITNKEEYLKVFEYGLDNKPMEEIPNPQVEYQG